MSGLRHILRRASRSVGEHPLLATASITTVATVLLLLGAFMLVLRDLSGVLDRWGQDVQVSCYLRPDVPDARIFELRAELLARPDVAAVRFVSADEALQRLGESLQGLDGLLADLDGNPLPASLEVRLDARHQAPAEVAAIARALQRPEFQALDWSQEWVERYHAFLGILRLSALVLGALLAFAAIVLVGVTLRLALHARRDELQIVALVGGTRWFRHGPLLAEGAALGGIGGALALAGLAAIHRFGFDALQASFGLLVGPELLRFLTAQDAALLVGGGVAIGLGGAWLGLSAAEDTTP